MSLENVALALVLTGGIVTTLLTINALARALDDAGAAQSRRDAEERRYAARDTPWGSPFRPRCARYCRRKTAGVGRPRSRAAPARSARGRLAQARLERAREVVRRQMAAVGEPVVRERARRQVRLDKIKRRPAKTSAKLSYNSALNARNVACKMRMNAHEPTKAATWSASR